MTIQTPKEVERTYNVALTGDLIVPVRLRYPIGDEPERLSEKARNEAIKRAVKLQAKKGDHRRFDADDAGVEFTREALVDARPVNLQPLEQKFGKQHSHASPVDTNAPRRGRNGWQA